MSNKSEIEQTVSDKLETLIRASNIWNYWEALVGVAVLALGVITALVDKPITGVVLILVGAALFNYAKTKQVDMVTNLHISMIWESILEHNECLNNLALTVNALDLCNKINEVLKKEEDNVDNN